MLVLWLISATIITIRGLMIKFEFTRTLDWIHVIVVDVNS